MSTQPRLPSSVEGAPPDLANMLGHAPGIIEAFGDLYAELWQRGILSADIREMTRIRNARITDCGF